MSSNLSSGMASCASCPLSSSKICSHTPPLHRNYSALIPSPYTWHSRLSPCKQRPSPTLCLTEHIALTSPAALLLSFLVPCFLGLQLFLPCLPPIEISLLFHSLFKYSFFSLTKALILKYTTHVCMYTLHFWTEIVDSYLQFCLHSHIEIHVLTKDVFIYYVHVCILSACNLSATYICNYVIYNIHTHVVVSYAWSSSAEICHSLGIGDMF